jgi:hypothetical protein
MDGFTTTSSGSSMQKVPNWRSQPQWVSRSIQQQCPNLQTLHSDMILGPCVRQLPHLVSCTTPQLGSSTAVAACGAGADGGVGVGAPAAKPEAPCRMACVKPQHKMSGGSCLSASALAAQGGYASAAAAASASSSVLCAAAKTHNGTAAAVRQEASWCCRERGVLCKCCS